MHHYFDSYVWVCECGACEICEVVVGGGGSRGEAATYCLVFVTYEIPH